MTFTRFSEIGDTGKTKIWSVDNSNDGSHIGVIKWHGAWRKYVLWPAPRTIWSPDCLRDVASFIDKEMDVRKPLPKNWYVRQGYDEEGRYDYCEAVGPERAHCTVPMGHTVGHQWAWYTVEERTRAEAVMRAARAAK